MSAGPTNGTVVLNPTFSFAGAGTPQVEGEGGGDRGGEEGGKAKSTLVLSAEKIDRRTALLTGYLRKKNSQDKWQRRYFEIVGQYWVYYKTNTSDEMLCAMDLWKASAPALVASTADDDGAQCEFSITWDRYRVFRASTPQEAVRWVNAIQQVQALRPPEITERPRTGPPTPSITRMSKGGDVAATKDARDWVEKQTGKRSAGHPGALNSDPEPEGGACGSCIIM